MKKRIIIAGIGETGLITATRLSHRYDIVGVSPKPCLLSGQELGTRLTRPEQWQKNYLLPFRRYKKLDGVTTLHGKITEIRPETNEVKIQLANGDTKTETFDALLISSGVSNGFWRNNTLENEETISSNLTRYAEQFSIAKTIAIVGGGATGVSVSANLATRYPDKNIHFFYSQERPLPGYHPKVRKNIESQLVARGVQLHPYHRAHTDNTALESSLTRETIAWESGQNAFSADLVLWAVGNVKPNSDFVPEVMLDKQGYVKTDRYLRVPGYNNIFSVGDIAASDPNRSSARNGGYETVAHNIDCYLRGTTQAMKTYKPSPYRWGSILGVQNNGLQVFLPNGSSIRFPLWAVNTILFPLIVRKGIYGGIRADKV
ncbi:MAG: FAD-dependent oxidoreductase [Pseudomonadales bacterium]|nr:FAD-dependent oxidoreductase [Pseudomonadales bacterium]